MIPSRYRGIERTQKEINKVLEHIRDEIEHLTYYWCEINPKSVIDDVLQIIDKYKGDKE